jgi:hypothetical protein
VTHLSPSRSIVRFTCFSSAFTSANCRLPSAYSATRAFSCSPEVMSMLAETTMGTVNLSSGVVNAAEADGADSCFVLLR